jgi:AraC-like DNA-binding protein
VRAIKENVLCTTETFTAYLFEGEQFNHSYHFHFEIEIVLIVKSHGSLVVGDHISTYEEGDVYVFGPNLPHSFVCGSDTHQAKSLVIQFDKNCFGEIFFSLPEFKTINLLLEKAQLGVRLRQKANEISSRISQTCASQGASSIISLLKLLHELSNNDNVETILDDFHHQQLSIETHRLNAAINWVDVHFNKPIQLNQVAELASLTEHAFCRAFKRATGKTFLQYLNDKRVHEAAQLLIETNRQITDIAYDVGFTNISSFNRYFKKVKQHSPSDFRRSFNILEQDH